MANESIVYGNLTTPVISTITKVNVATDGMFFLFILIILFFIILGAFYKRYHSFEKGLSAAGFVCGILGAALTAISGFSWTYIWMCIVFFIIGFLAKNFE